MTEMLMAQYKQQMEISKKQALDSLEASNKLMGVKTSKEQKQAIIDGFDMQLKMYEQSIGATMGAGMPDLSSMMSGFGGAMDYANMGQNLMDAMGFDSEGDDEEVLAFIEQNPVAKENQKYTLIGAVLIGSHYEPHKTLKLMMDKDESNDLLTEGWGISNQKEAVEMLESLLQGRHATKFAKDFEKAKKGKLDDEDYDITVEGITDALELSKKLVDDCKTLYAWDADRIGYLVRLFYSVGYLTEKECWDWMKKAATEIKKNFKSWEEYIVSLLLGRALAMGFNESTMLSACDLIENETEYLKQYPISKL